MAIGLLEERDLTLAAAPGVGNLVVLFGSTTGRDGIGGASVLASATFADDDPSKRPSVQVGDPFAEKLLIEASLELIRDAARRRASRTSAPAGSPARRPRRRTGPGPGCGSSSPRSRVASPGWSRSRS